MMVYSVTDMVAGWSLLSQAGVFDVFYPQGLMDAPAVGWERFVEGWRGVTDLGVLVPMAASILLAVLLAIPLAYHPRIYRRAATIEEIEAPKGMIVYAALSAAIAQVVALMPAMALVVFGIGGIFRFRTRAGPPKQIGPTIEVVVVGLACGMMVFPLAIVLTALAWTLPFWFESRYAVSLQVKSLEGGGTAAAAARYGGVLERRGGNIVSVRMQRTGEFSIVAKVPSDVNAAELEAELRELPTEGIREVRWETG